MTAIGAFGGLGGFASSSTTRLSRLMLYGISKRILTVSYGDANLASITSALGDSGAIFSSYSAIVSGGCAEIGVGVGDTESRFGEVGIRSAVRSRLKARPMLEVRPRGSSVGRLDDCSGAEELSITSGRVCLSGPERLFVPRLGGES
jgi:hypothetical protein